MKKFFLYFTAIIIACCALAFAPGRASAEITDKQYVALRDEMKSLYLVQSILSWHTRTGGERSVFQESYKGHEALYSLPSIKYVGGMIAQPGLSDDDRRAARFFKNALTLEYIGIDTAHFDDEVNNAEASATVKIEWIPAPVPYRQLLALAAQESDADKRQKLQDAQAQVWKDLLNPIHERAEKRVRELAVELGYPSYVTLSEDFREVNLKDFIARSQKFIAKSDASYKKILAAEVQEVMGFPVEKFRRADIQYFSSVPAFKSFFPAELTVPAFKYFLEGMGLDLTTAAGTQIMVDDGIRDKKEPRAACYQMTVPDDVRITVKPTGGIPDFETFFHEGGHAMHFANTTIPQWEFQQLGSNAVTEGFAIFFENIWGDYEWLKKYRELEKEYNRFQPPEKQAALMTDADMGKLIRNRVFWKLYMVRRYNGAKLVYESLLHGGDPSYYKEYYTGPADDPRLAYRKLFSDAYGFQLSDADSLRFRTDVDSVFYSADYARAFLLSEQLEEAMRSKFGDKWFNDPRAGELLKKSLWSNGSKPHPDDLARLIGFKQVDYEQFEKRMNEQLAIAEKLMNSK
ncbi:MAG: hypothetical protein WCX65_10900 [bacterium]